MMTRGTRYSTVAARAPVKRLVCVIYESQVLLVGLLRVRHVRYTRGKRELVGKVIIKAVEEAQGDETYAK